MASKRAFFLFGCALAGLGLGACGPDPYTLERIDYDGDQRPAAIMLGDPQVYSRETLINDRRSEVEFLEQLLKETEINAEELKTKTPDFRTKFQPQVLSEIRSIEALSTALGVTFDPSQGADAQRRSRIADLETELAAKNLEIEIARREKILEGVQAAPAPTETIDPKTDTEAKPSKDTAKGNLDAKGQIPKLRARLDELQKVLLDLQKESAPAVRKTAASPNPRDLFFDIQAYRSELRSALNAARLDDRHDDIGNALIRLQFDATVLPGHQPNRQWGATRITIKEPKLDRYKLQQLYFSWLSYAASRLHLRTREPKQETDRELFDVKFDANYYSLLVSTGLFEIVPIFFDIDHKLGTYRGDKCLESSKPLSMPGCVALYLPVPIGLASDIKGYFINPRAKLTRDACKAIDVALQGAAHGIRANELDTTFGVKAFIIDFILLLQNDRNLSNACKKRLPASRDGLCREGDFGGDCFNPEAKHNNRNVCEFEAWERPTYLFACLVSGSARRGTTPSVGIYEVGPAELVERRSAVASAAQSFETAVALAAALPSSGVGVDAGLGYMRSVSGKVDALERLPLVIGFANKTKKDNNATGPSQNVQFGWLFGPRMEVNEKRQIIELVHRPARFDVVADISAPAWWPSIDLTVETAWVGNWNLGEDVFASCKDEPACRPNSREITVPLPTSIEAFNGLTEFVLSARGRILANQPTIAQIHPSTLSACAEEVQFVIEGSNLWRTPQVYLGGQLLEQPRVLPNMRGISAKVDIGKYFALSTSQNADGAGITELEMTVATRDGVATSEVFITGARTGEKTCESATPGAEATSLLKRPAKASKPQEPAKSDPPKDIAIAPTSLSACQDQAALVVTGENLPVKNANANVVLGGIVGKVDEATAKSTGITVTFPGKLAPFKDTGQAEMVFQSGGVVTTQMIEIKPCP